MPFPPGKTIQELGIDTTRKFVVVDDDGLFLKKGTILTLDRDDGSLAPYFKDSSGRAVAACLFRLEYAPKQPIFKKSLTQKLMNIFKSEPEKSLREAGLIDGDDMPTGLGVRYWIAMQLQDKATAEEFKSKVADKILKKK